MRNWLPPLLILRKKKDGPYKYYLPRLEIVLNITGESEVLHCHLPRLVTGVTVVTSVTLLSAKTCNSYGQLDLT